MEIRDRGNDFCNRFFPSSPLDVFKLKYRIVEIQQTSLFSLPSLQLIVISVLWDEEGGYTRNYH